MKRGAGHRKAVTAGVEVVLTVAFLCGLNSFIDAVRASSGPMVFENRVQISHTASDSRSGEVPHSEVASDTIPEEAPPQKRKMKAVVTTYNAEPEQTDGDPTMMASMRQVYEGAAASNCYPFGTRLSIAGVGEVTIWDRMNSRYTEDCGTDRERIDVFKWNREDNFLIEDGEYVVEQ